MKFRFILLFVGSVLYFNHAAALKRNEVLNNGIPYYQLVWYCDIINSYNENLDESTALQVGHWIMGEAYCWTRWDKHTQFIDKLAVGQLAGCINTSLTYDDINGNATGLDCSGFISRCFNLSDHYSTKVGTKYVLQDIAKQISSENIRPGDILILPNKHTILFVEGLYNNASIVESVIRTAESIYQVKYRDNINCGALPEGSYSCYSIFPNLQVFIHRLIQRCQ